MSDHHSKTTWPLTKFQFEVDFGELGTGSFLEVTGLAIQPATAAYTVSNSKMNNAMPMPKLTRQNNVVFTKGTFKDHKKFRDFYNQLQIKNTKRSDITVQLLDETGSLSMQWTLNNAVITKLSVTNFGSDETETYVENIEIVFEEMITGSW